MSIVAECLRDKSQPLSYNFDVIDRDELEPKEIQQVFDAKFKEKPMKREKNTINQLCYSTPYLSVQS